MKCLAFLAFVALATAYDFTSYQPKQIGVTDANIFVAYQGWNIQFTRPVDQLNFLEVYITGPKGFSRRVLIDNQFQVVKDYYLNNDYSGVYREQYGSYYLQKFGQSFPSTVNFNQYEYLIPIFSQYAADGILDVQEWGQLLNTLQTEVQQGRVHFLIYEFLNNFANEEFFYGKQGYQYYGPSQYQGQYYDQSRYGKYPFYKYFGKYFGKGGASTGLTSQGYYDQQYSAPYNQQYYGQQYSGPYNQQYYGQQYYAPYAQQYYGQQYSTPYSPQYYGQQYYGPYNQQYYGQQYSTPYSQQYYGQQYYGPYNQQYYGQNYYGKQYDQFYGSYRPYQQYYGQYYGYPEYQGQYHQSPSFWNRFVRAY